MRVIDTTWKDILITLFILFLFGMLIGIAGG